jgi:hypothetical protein
VLLSPVQRERHALQAVVCRESHRLAPCHAAQAVVSHIYCTKYCVDKKKVQYCCGQTYDVYIQIDPEHYKNIAAWQRATRR